MRLRIPLLLLFLSESVLLCTAQSASSTLPATDRIEAYCFGCPGSDQVGTKPLSTAKLIQLADEHSPALQRAISETYPEKALAVGRVWSSHQHDFFFAVRAPAQPVLFLDDQPGPLMQSIAGSDLWYTPARIDRLATTHSFYYRLNGKDFGGNPGNMPAFGDFSYPMPGAKHGALSEKQTLISKIYEGMKTDYWVYVPSAIDPQVASPVMFFLDGELTLTRDGGSKTLDVIDNLIALKRIPVAICVFVDPGTFDSTNSSPTAAEIRNFATKTQRTIPDATRSILYDTVSDRYPRFLSDELLSAIKSRYNVREDGYGHAVMGFSSGGIAAFNAAWQLPQSFSRVVSGIGSFASIQWKTIQEASEGGQDFPDKVLQEPHRNIRVWLQDGSGDLELPRYGSWPLNNIRLANALKLANYDFHFSFDKSGHGPEAVEAQLPDVLTWLWRDYDPAKTGQMFEMEPTERSKPVFRVAIANRDAQ